MVDTVISMQNIELNKSTFDCFLLILLVALKNAKEVLIFQHADDVESSDFLACNSNNLSRGWLGDFCQIQVAQTNFSNSLMRSCLNNE